MTPTILVVGSTGNTGKAVVRDLPKLLESSKTKFRIIGLTRSINSAASQDLAKLPGVEMIEKDWTDIDAEWLQAHNVTRVYIAPHNLPNQFQEESGFYLALLNARVEYVVKVSTNVEYISPTNPVYYGRAHWAIETLLSQPEYKALKWTSLQPNFFTISYLQTIAEWVNEYKKTGKQDTLRLVPASDAPVAMIDPNCVGSVGARLLALADPSPHNNARYVLSGPQDVTGRELVALAEKYAGVKAEDVEFNSVGWIEDLAKSGLYPSKVISSIKSGCIPLWEGKCSLAGTPTSKEVMELCPPKGTVENALQLMLVNWVRDHRLK